ncbi:MFS transporter [Desulfopila inferna]|uniref:MFS transporter n=1 Tax=Desulfopila inferna TaxID=468528 RepID=UPI00196310BD|nr:MFS transporter [Desulfopila inferna]MBM9605680.1 MFS transporter [Desulfopila inferna]
MSAEADIPTLSKRERTLVIWAALLALFLGALDALIMSAAMPSIVAELGGLSLYAWVYSAYFLFRAVSLPVFGKLADIYDTRKLFLFSIVLFLISSVAAGMAYSMPFLIICRVFQGIGAGGNFALVYIVLSEVAPPGKRARTLSLGSTVWGISSVIGPTLGGFIVSYFSWRWIFFINIPIGILSLFGIAYFLRESGGREKQKGSLDLAGLFFFSMSVLALLVIFTAGGREVAWTSVEMIVLMGTTVLLGVSFYRIERRVVDPMIKLRFFRNRNFSLGNGAIFFASVTIFSLFAYVPIYIQGSLGLSPMQVGLAMVSLSLGWSAGALYYGRMTRGGNEKNWSVAGGLVLLVGSLFTLRFDLQTGMGECFLVFLLVGIGMGIVSLSTLILVQNSVTAKDLGIVTSFHQFGRSLGGTIGVGISGGLVTSALFRHLEKTAALLPPDLMVQLQQGAENILRLEFQSQVPQATIELLREGVLSGVYSVFLVSSLASLCCLFCCLGLSGGAAQK